MKKILIIDDSAFARNTLKRILGGKFDFVEAEEGMQGIEKFYLEKPDLVILDLTMPGMKGMDVLTRMKQINPACRIIIGTADVQDYSRIESERLGADAYIIKPYMPENVQQVVESLLKEKAE